MLHYHVLNLTGDFGGGLLEAPLYPLKPGVSRGAPGLSGPLRPHRNSTTGRFLADRTNGRAYATVLRLSSSSSVTLGIVAKRYVLEQKLLLAGYRKSCMRNRLVPK